LLSSGLASQHALLGAPGDGAAAETRAQRYERLLSRLVERNPRLDDVLSRRIIDAAMRCEEHPGLRADLVMAVLLKESGGRPHVRSRAGAIGLMQVMPHMWRRLGVPGSIGHVESNIEAGCLLLADNLRRLGEDRGVSAYYWGNGIRDDVYLNGVRDLLEFLAQRANPGEWGA
jgi:soluble lytic murein transglycosylase-like protein